jgi:hypothetical protein
LLHDLDFDPLNAGHCRPDAGPFPAQ